MELMVADQSGADLGPMDFDSGDFDWGHDGGGDLSLVTCEKPVPPVGCHVYDPATGACGRVTGHKASTGSPVVTVLGDSWTGMLDCHVIGPDQGQDYLTLSGDVADVVAQVVARAGMSSTVRVKGHTGVGVTHTMTGSRSDEQRDAGRYMGVWAAIWQVLTDHGCAIDATWDGGVSLTVRRAADWTGDEAAYVGLATVTTKRAPATNHLVCLGRGELHDRERVDVYADVLGRCGTDQTQAGAAERAEVYEYSGSDDLLADGLRKLRGMQAKASSVTVDVSDGVTLGIGDVVGGTDPVTGDHVRATVSECIARVSGGSMRLEYKTIT